MPRTARTTTRSAPLASEFGRGYATYLFGEEFLADIPTFNRGPKKGLPKGYVIWLRTTEAGYHPNAGTGVAADTTVRAWVAEYETSPESSAYIATFLGRKQNVCASMHLLGPENRKRREEQMAREEARRQEELTELRAKP